MSVAGISTSLGAFSSRSAPSRKFSKAEHAVALSLIIEKHIAGLADQLVLRSPRPSSPAAADAPEQNREPHCQRAFHLWNAFTAPGLYKGLFAT